MDCEYPILINIGEGEVYYMINETIAAISTSPMGTGGIGIVRISGSQAVEIADKLFVSKKSDKKLADVASHTVHFGNIIFENEIIDEVLVIVMKAPNTYTKEDIVEIDCHGGIFVMKKILSAVIENGATPAEPGEFTKRAFLNGRIDLSQAEAVIDIINSKNEYALKSSVSQLNGNLLSKIKEIREIILDNVAFIEAALDDPEHISLDHFVEKLTKNVDNCVDNLQILCITSENGRIIKDGVKTVILGKTNAGKSSLLNVLAKEERAIVTEVEGTTRDILEEHINMGGVLLNLIDTAGIRNTQDIVEKIGVNKARQYSKDADLIIYVVDASRELDENDREILELIKDKKVIVLLNKTDMDTVIDSNKMKELIQCPIISISAKLEIGIDMLEKTIKEMFFNGEVNFNDEIYITNIRQKNLLNEAVKSLKLVKDSIELNMPEDFFTIDLMNAYEQLGKVIGESVEEDLVNQIFSKFCMGK